MGREIIRQECPEDLGRRSRIWDSEAYHVLTRNMGTRAIEGLFLDICKFDPIQFAKESFKQMDRLRLLKIHKESLPTNFHAKDLVELILRGSNIKQLWRGNKLHNELKVINLNYSVHLTEIPDFSSVPNLEILTLEGYTMHIPELPSSLRLLDAHGSNPTSSRASFLPVHSLVNCFNSEIQDLNCSSRNEVWSENSVSTYGSKGICIVLPGSSGVPEWIMDDQGIATELPQNWNQNNEFLGFALCCVYVPLDDESEDVSENESDNRSEDESAHTSENEIDDKSKNDSVAELSDCFCYDQDNDSVSRQTWVIWYSKAAIQEWYPSDQWPYINVRRCSECQQEATCRWRGCFKDSDMKELPIIENPSELDGLCLRDCKNLQSLPAVFVSSNPLQLSLALAVHN
ncbi:putative WRKY transcription factor 19 [Vitis vinifera]|uniref:Putative WRKY transcription factor 19 n=1 Tax=Vitis vinifera TaxID=29760 RepID=A0A438JDM4_VITVI|nr:putative WRKY transcription factor 19 [Vitis vinifera]